MTKNGQSKDEGSNGVKKKVVNGTGSNATKGNSYALRSLVRDSSSNKQVPAASPQGTRRSERFVKSAAVLPVTNRKSGRISKELMPSPLRRSYRRKEQISSGSKKSEKVSVAVDLDQMQTKREKSLSELMLEGNKCEDVKSGRGERHAYDGRTFRALFRTQVNVKATADKNGINSPERDGIVEGTSANAEKLVVDCAREEQLQTSVLAGSVLIKKSHDDGIDKEHGDNTALSKRKMNFVVDLDAPAIDGRTQRHQKKVQYFDDSPKQAECEAVEVGKKRKKGGANLSSGLEQDKTEGDKIAGVSGIPENHGLYGLEAQDDSATDLLYAGNAPAIVSDKRILPDKQNNFHLSKSSILKLCEILKLSDEVKNMAEQFLEYVISKYQVRSYLKNSLQAFLISLCWSSASLLNQKVDRKGSLILAQQHLNFICNEKEADCVYSVVCKLKKAFKEDVLSDLSKDNVSY